MPSPYRLKTLLRHLDETLLVDYMGKRDIDDVPFTPAGKELNPDEWDEFITRLPLQKKGEIENDFREVNDLSDEAGTLNLLRAAQDAHLSLEKELEPIQGSYNKAMFFFLKYSHLFQYVSMNHYLTDLTAKAERTGLKQAPAEKILKQKDALAAALRTFLLKNEARGRHCHVDTYHFKEGNRVCFVAYPEDYAKTDFYYDDGQLRRECRRNSFEIVYVYYPELGKLELKAKGGKKKEVALFNIFNSVVLQDNTLVMDTQKIYNLDMFLDKNLTLATEPEDQVEYVALTKLSLSYKNGSGKLTLEPKNARDLRTMQANIDDLSINRNLVHVTQATLSIKFPGKGKRGGVSLQLTWPDRCNLSDEPLHLKAKRYLYKWGLENYQKRDEDPPKPSGSIPSPSAV
jgi:hypothetical protein